MSSRASTKRTSSARNDVQPDDGGAAAYCDDDGDQAPPPPKQQRRNFNNIIASASAQRQQDVFHRGGSSAAGRGGNRRGRGGRQRASAPDDDDDLPMDPHVAYDGDDTTGDQADDQANRRPRTVGDDPLLAARLRQQAEDYQREQQQRAAASASYSKQQVYQPQLTQKPPVPPPKRQATLDTHHQRSSYHDAPPPVDDYTTAVPDDTHGASDQGTIQPAAAATADPSDMQYVADVMQSIKDPRAIDPNHSGPCVTYRKCANIIYDYSTFKMENVVFAKTPITATEGELLYINYKHTPQTRDFLKINTPTLFSPTGVTMKNNKLSTMLSLGKNWEDDPDAVAFKCILDDIALACAHVIVERNWVNVKRDVTVEEARQVVRPIIYTGTDKEGNDYPPAFGANISTTKACHSNFVLRREDMSVPIPAGTVPKGSWMTSVIHVRWIHRKIQSDRRAFPLGCSYSINVVIFNAVVHPKEDSIPDDVCVVQIKNDPFAAPAPAPSTPGAPAAAPPTPGVAVTTAASATTNDNPPPIAAPVDASTAPTDSTTSSTMSDGATSVQPPQQPPPGDSVDV